MDDFLFNIRHDTHFPEADTGLGQFSGNMGNVLVMRSTAQDFVPDDQQGSRHGFSVAHFILPSVPTRFI
jgi:hypothetical protein